MGLGESSGGGEGLGGEEDGKQLSKCNVCKKVNKEIKFKS